MLGLQWYMFASFYGLVDFLVFLREKVDMWITDPEVDSRPALCSCIQRTAWFDSGYMQYVSLRSFSYS